MATESTKSNVVSMNVAKHGEVMSVDPDQIYPDPKQVRKYFDDNDLEALAESMQIEGQTTPILVNPPDRNGRYKIQNGERRWRAAKLRGLTIDIIVDREKRKQGAIRSRQLVDNIQREDLRPLEISTCLQAMIDEDEKSQQDIAEAIGKSQTWVSTHLALNPNKLPECVIDLHDANITRDYEILNTLRKLHENNPERCEALCSSAVESGITRKQAIEALRDSKKIADDIEAESRKPESMKIDNQESAAEAEYKADLKESGGDEEGFEMPEGEEIFESSATDTPDDSPQQTDEAKAPEDLQDYETLESEEPENPLKDGWTKREPNYASIIVNVITDKDAIRAKLAIERLDTDQEHMWVAILNPKTNKYRYQRVHVSDIEIVKVVA